MGWANEERELAATALRRAAKRCGLSKEGPSGWGSVKRRSPKAHLKAVADWCAASSGPAGARAADGGDEAERVGAREGLPPAGAERCRVDELHPDWRFPEDRVVDAEAPGDVHRVQRGAHPVLRAGGDNKGCVEWCEQSAT